MAARSACSSAWTGHTGWRTLSARFSTFPDLRPPTPWGLRRRSSASACSTRARPSCRSRARYCGLASDTAACACHRRVPAALRLGRIREDALDFADQASSYRDTRAFVRQVEEARWALRSTEAAIRVPPQSTSRVVSFTRSTPRRLRSADHRGVELPTTRQWAAAGSSTCACSRSPFDSLGSILRSLTS